MIFINNAKKKIGQNGLIINQKANNFYEKDALRPEDFHRLFDVFTKYDSKINMPIAEKTNFFLCILYYESNYNESAKNILLSKLSNEEELYKGCSSEDKLHILFNIAEIEIKIRKKNQNGLKVLRDMIKGIEYKQRIFEDHLLQKYYYSYINYLLGEYSDAVMATDEIIIEIDESKNLKVDNLIKYMKIINELLKVKILEESPEKNYKEIISHLDGLFCKTKNTKEDFAICVGIKMLSLESKEIITYEECIKLIKEMLNILKRETLFGKSHKNILDQYLYLSGLLGYYNSINDDFDGVKKATKKIDKYLSNVHDILKNKDKNKENKEYNDLYKQYSYFNSVLKSSVNINNSSIIKQSQLIIKEYQDTSNNQSDKDILNMCILEGENLSMSTKLNKMEALFKEWIGQKKDLNEEKIMLLYFYKYNQVSEYTKKIVNSLDDPYTIKDIHEIRKFVGDIITSTSKQVIDNGNETLKKVFRLPFFKNLFNRLYYVKIYTYYLEMKYKECLNEFEEYKIAKIQFELGTPKSTEYMRKVQADCLFKLKKYKEAEESYNIIIQSGSKDPLILFNLSLTQYFNNKTDSALSNLEKAMILFKEEDNKKARVCEDLIKKIKG